MSSLQPRRKTTAKSNDQSFASQENSAPEAELTPDAAETGMELYSSPDGAVSLTVRFDGETAWATQAQMAELFAVDVRTVNEHIGNAFSSGELNGEATVWEFRIVRREGQRVTTVVMEATSDYRNRSTTCWRKCYRSPWSTPGTCATCPAVRRMCRRRSGWHS